MKFINVAVPVPLRQVFTYTIEDALFEKHKQLLGKRVLVPFGNRQLVGVCVDENTEAPALKENDESNKAKTKTVIDVLNRFASIPAHLLDLAAWLADYYQHPMGDVLATMLPVALRKAMHLEELTEEYLTLSQTSEAATETLTKKQQSLFSLLTENQQKMPLAEAKKHFSTGIIKALIEKNVAYKLAQSKPLDTWQVLLKKGAKLKATVEQSIAIARIEQAQGFNAFLLEGITGSGKTEVYLQALEHILQKGKQVLILVPEIGLTPQTVERFEKRFGSIVSSLHSGLTNKQRLDVWHQARRGDKGVFIGTRSSIFLPFYDLGLVIVDEEHDESFKQQDGLRYHARDLAVYRAKKLNIPVVIGSATPSLESLSNATSGKYYHLTMTHRTGSANLPSQHILNLNGLSLQSGIATGLLDKVQEQLDQGNQVLFFVNRRGYAPALQCNQCGHVEECEGCSAPMTLHASTNNLQCHRCGAIKRIPHGCNECGSTELVAQGVGTEKLEQFLDSYFEGYKSVRIDSDSARSKITFTKMLEDIHANEYRLLVGTQILSKGHHFPNVTLAIILNIDSLLFSGDFRAPERIGQLVTQLSGRAGRANKKGEVWLQTHQPGHPLLQDLVNNGFTHYSRSLLHERKAANLPPFSYLSILRTETENIELGLEFLKYARSMLMQFSKATVLGPLPCLIEKKQRRFRYQLLIRCDSRQYLNAMFTQVLDELDKHKRAKQIRWHVDMHPTDIS